MRRINGIAGCKKGEGAKEIEDEGEVSVRVVDCVDNYIAIRIGTHPESARLSSDEARHLASLLNDAADRAEAR
jgi:hypothetical protein